MPFLHEQTLTVSPTARKVLESLIRRHSTSQQLAQRAQLVLALADCYSQADAALAVGLLADSTRKWRERWIAQQEMITELGQDTKAVLKRIKAVLADEPKPKRPSRFTPEQVARLQALACEIPPPEIGTHWSTRILAEEAMRRGIVEQISHMGVWRFLKAGCAQAS